MSSINKLSIRGVRAFSPDEQEQVVEFYFPLTIITGANGCGKTTIIESLKYALSGSLPPMGNARSAGQSFVHDPTQNNSSVVKANIKLRFTNKAGNSMVVIRSMELAKKKTTMTFKQLDGALRTMDPETGKRETLSHKCSELDRQIPELLGVSKAILDYVLFVHQEDSSWPAGDAATLKKRFDEIFDSTKYTKALDTCRKTKKELTSQMKDIKAEMMGLGSHKHAAKEFRKDKESYNDSLQKVEDDIAECDKIISESQTESDRLMNIIEEIQAIGEVMNTKKTEIDHLEAMVQKQSSMLEKDLTQEHDVRKLKDMLRDFDKEITNQQDRQDELTRDCKAIENEIEALRKEELKLNSDKGKFAAEKAAQERRIRDRIHKMEALAQSYTLELEASLTQLSRIDASFSASQSSLTTGGETSLKLSAEDVRAFFITLAKKEEDLKEKLRSHKATYRTQENEFNATLQELVGKKNSFESERAKLNNENKNVDTELKRLNTGGARVKKASIEEFRETAKEHAKRLEELTRADKRDQLNTQIRSHNDERDKLEEQIDDLKNVKRRLQSSAKLKSTIDILRSQRSKDIKKLNDLIENKSNDLKSLNIDVVQIPSDGSSVSAVVQAISDKVSSKFQEASGKTAKAQDEESKYRRALSQEEGTLMSLQQTNSSLQKRKSDLEGPSGSVEKVNRVVKTLNDLGSPIFWEAKQNDPQEIMDEIANCVKKQESDYAKVAPESVSVIVKRIRKLGRNKEGSTPFCPCCTRQFANDDEYNLFVQTTKDLQSEDSPLIKNIDPQQMEQYNNQKLKYERCKETVAACMKDLHDYRRILADAKEIEPKIQQLEASVKEKKKSAAGLKTDLIDCQEAEKQLRDLLQSCKAWSSEADRIDEQAVNISDKQEQLDCETAGDIGSGSLEEVENEIESKIEKSNRYVELVNKANKAISSINEEIASATKSANRTAELLRQKEEKYAQEQKDYERKKELDKRKTVISQEVQKLGEQISSLQQKIKTKEAEKARLYSHASDEENKLNESLNQFLSESKHLRDISTQIDEYASKGGGDRLDKISADVAKVLADIAAKKKDLESLQPQLEEVIASINDQERHKKLLRENIDLLKSKKKIAELETEVAQLEKDQNNVAESDTAESRVDALDNAIGEARSKKSRLEGRRSEIIEQIRSLNRKLQSNEYKGVDERHRKEVIKFETTQMAINDLDKYASALDKALLRFHSIKIAEINQIIKELWLLTYKGEDITNIELVSGQDSRAAKSYNYRVVMTKGGSPPMDMRGRCSAGQRVLASIVIRLALAETFGVMCGCLVLDEPTVNLDEHNKKGLAKAMAQIIASRSKQSNFQLVLITHDESFVSLMKEELSTQGGFSMPEKYFHVRREEDASGAFVSKIDAVDWDEMI